MKWNASKDGENIRYLCRECAPTVIDDVESRVPRVDSSKQRNLRSNDNSSHEDASSEASQSSEHKLERVEPKLWRTRFRGVDDLDSDEEGAYETWPEQIKREKKEDYW